MRLAAILAALTALSGVAEADQLRLPAGTEIRMPDDPDFVWTLGETHFAVDRESLDRANAAAELNRRLRHELERCSATVAELEQDEEPGWLEGLKWGATGLAIGAAFAAGLVVGQGDL